MIADSVAKAGVEETRLRILAATRELYASKGSRGTTTREVSDRAGVNEATVFRHFGTKAQLLAAMLDYYSNVSAFPEMLERVRSFPTIDAQLRQLALSCIDSVKKKQDLIRISMAEELDNPDGQTCAWRAPTAARAELVKYFAEQVSSGVLRGDPEWLARAFMSLFFAFVMVRKIWADLDASPETAAAAIVEIFLNGASAN